jgi:hypothetical protein
MWQFILLCVLADRLGVTDPDVAQRALVYMMMVVRQMGG